MIRNDGVSKPVRQVVEQTKEVISDYLNSDWRHINLRHSLKGDFHLDSLDVVELFTSLEQRFKVYFPEDLSRIRLVKDIVIECQNKLNHKKF